MVLHGLAPRNGAQDGSLGHRMLACPKESQGAIRRNRHGKLRYQERQKQRLAGLVSA